MSQFSGQRPRICLFLLLLCPFFSSKIFITCLMCSFRINLLSSTTSECQTSYFIVKVSGLNIVSLRSMTSVLTGWTERPVSTNQNFMILCTVCIHSKKTTTTHISCNYNESAYSMPECDLGND